MNDNTKVIAALVGGLAAGAVLGILFAPDKGSETRDNVTQALKNLEISIKETISCQADQLLRSKDKKQENSLHQTTNT